MAYDENTAQLGKSMSSGGVNQDVFFATEHLERNLKNRLAGGIAVTTASQVFKFLLQMTSTIVLARLLTPSDYGLIGMSIVAVRFAQMFKDMGLSAATIQSKKITHAQVSTLFWINFAVSLLIASAVALSSPLVAKFYEEPRLQVITMTLSLTFVLSGLSIQHQALLKRQMRFLSISFIDTVAMAVGVASAILVAILGGTYWSLIVLHIVIAFITAAGSWCVCKWRPGFPRKRSGVKKMFFFGSNLTGFNVLNFFARNADNILIGRFLGAGPLGIYDKAYQLLLLPIQQINGPIQSVALPALCRLQNEPDKYRNYYYHLITLMTALGMPIVSFMFVNTDKIILLILGENWISAIEIFRYLMPAALVGTFNFAEGWAYQSLGRTDRQLRIGVVLSTLIVLVFVFSVQGGIKTVAIAYGISLPIFRVPSLLYCYHKTPLNVWGLLKAIFLPFTASLIAGVTLALSKMTYLPGSSSLYDSYGLIADFLIFTVTYSLTWLVFPHGRKTLAIAFNSFSNLQGK